MELIVILVLVYLMLTFTTWLANLTSAKKSGSHYGFITYKKFKQYFNPDEWEAPSHFENKVLIKGSFDTNRMSVDSATFLYEGKAMLPATPWDYYLIANLINKTVDEKKTVVKSKRVKW